MTRQRRADIALLVLCALLLTVILSQVFGHWHSGGGGVRVIGADGRR